jgi:hypothetical protein
MSISQEITIRVSSQTAETYQKTTAREKQCLEALVALFLDQGLNSEIDFSGKIMDEISDRAVARGLTPATLDSVLNE